jgi:O-antigen/teichoic acid export membrane protein
VGSYIFIPLAGINGVGWSWLAGNVAACFIGALFLLRAKKQGGRIYDEI